MQARYCYAIIAQGILQSIVFVVMGYFKRFWLLKFHIIAKAREFTFLGDGNFARGFINKVSG